MNRSFSFSVVLAALLALAGCSGGSDNSILGVSTPEGEIPEIPVQSIQLLASSPQLPSDQTGLETVLLTAIAQDTNNNALEGVTILFDAGGDPSARIAEYSNPDRQTNASGLLTATLSNGINGATERAIRVTATNPSTNVSASIVVNVVGTTISLDGPRALPVGNDIALYTTVLTDSKGNGIPAQTVVVTSALGNPIAQLVTDTDPSGKLSFTMTPVNSGNDTLTVTAFNQATSLPVAISNDQFTLSHGPSATDDIPLRPANVAPCAVGVVEFGCEDVTVTWAVGGVAQAGQTITFNSTRGTLSATSAVTNGAGQATVAIWSTTAGPSIITAANAGGTTAALPLEFVATNPTQISVQATPFTVGPNEAAEIRAIVRDPNDNLVKNQLVNFLIVRDDTNGFLTSASSVTDSTGRATTFYTGGQTQGAENGVEVAATVAVAPLVTNSATLTVARSEFDFIIGFGRDLQEVTLASVAQEWNIIVTDSVGNAVANTPIQVSLRSLFYYKGFLRVPPGGSRWSYANPENDPPIECNDEDVNRNGILEPIEDGVGTGGNGSGQMEAGNVATVVAVSLDAPPDDPCTTPIAGSTSTAVTTNNQGIARVCVIWPKNFGWWVRGQIEAQSLVSGSESSQAQGFLLPALDDEINSITKTPSNVESPFGIEQDCTIPPPGLPL
jgi:hypothetical protein